MMCGLFTNGAKELKNNDAGIKPKYKVMRNAKMAGCKTENWTVKELSIG